MFDATSAYALLSLHGPRSRDTLQAVSGDDISDTSLPFGAAREIDLGYARVWIVRRSFFGELGFELLVATEFAAHVADTLQQHKLKHAGMFAMNACRLEKAFRHFGHDIGEDDTPFEVGLGFAVDMDKGDFLAREALRKAGPLTDRLAVLALEKANKQAGPHLLHNEPVWCDGNIVGHVTSGGWGFRANRMIGLAAVHNPDGVSADWLAGNNFTVQIAGAHHPARLQLQPIYDPTGSRMRS